MFSFGNGADRHEWNRRNHPRRAGLGEASEGRHRQLVRLRERDFVAETVIPAQAVIQTLLDSPGTSEIATVLISDVRANFSVAQVLPDTLRGVLQKGDSAVLLR